MKVLIIHTKYKVKGGEEVIVENESALLKERGIKVETLFFENKEGIINSTFQFLQLPFNVGSYYKVLNKIKSFEPDVVHIHNWNYTASPSIIRAALNRKIPVVNSIHNYRLLCPSGTLFHNGDLFLNSLKSAFPWTAVRKKVYRNSLFQTFWLALTIYVHKKIGTWSSISSYLVNTGAKKDLFLKSNLNLNESQVIVKPNSSPDQDCGIDKRNKSFVFVGRLNREKGLQVLLDAFVKTKHNLIIIGDGPLKTTVEEYASSYGNINYKGRLTHKETLNEIKKASSLVFPSIWYEGMPMTIVEAFSTGTPVISSFIGAMESMIVDKYNGLHFTAGDETDLIKKLNLWSALGEVDKKSYEKNARKSYEQYYTPQKNLDTLVNTYNSIILKRMQLS
jgi:glycosyltransferase involved in cell wall biosynthesis